ncbi:hypothetical protein DL96DRAFT_1028026 [Flagelloscypha sp. PMI_526]|nr:hypothetical protein DL96DRAFT_1028026 [Flagelloscypha sp. PMI_526]
MPAPKAFLDWIDANADRFIQRLAEAVAIPSVSGEFARRDDTIRMMHWFEKQLKDVGVETKLADLGTQEAGGKTYPLPPALLGKIGNDRSKKTVFIYGHLDANKSDGWDSEPFELFVHPTNGQLIGRGSTDDKGPVLGWLHVLEYHHQHNEPLPVNLKFCFEGMEESGSLGLDPLVISESKPGGWFEGVDCACISDNYWLNTRTPALCYGLRGQSYFNIIVSGPGRDLHSGIFGRTVHEPMTDLMLLMSKLVDSQGNILVPGVEDLVPPPTAEELKLFESLDYGIQDVEDAAGGPIALSSDKVKVLMGRMRYPALSMHGIEGAFDGVGSKTVIPSRVIGKFSIRLVPPQTPELVAPLTIKYLEDEFSKMGSRNTLEVKLVKKGHPWVADTNHWNFEAAKRATKVVYGVDPDLMRDGGSIPVTLTFAENLKTNVVLLPMGRGDDGAHSTNEKLDRSNYIEGTKLLGTYLYEIGAS